MPLTHPTPIFAWVTTDPSSDAWDGNALTWYYFGGQGVAQEQPILNKTDSRWVEANEYPNQIYEGKQTPAWVASYTLTSGYPIYMIMPSESWSSPTHTLTISSTPSNNVLPEYSIQYYNVSDSATAWILFWAKCNQATLEFDFGEPGMISQSFFGRVPWVYNNANAADNVTVISNPLITSNPTMLGTSDSYTLDGRSVITYDGSTWSYDVVKVDINLVRGCQYNHTTQTTFQQEIWPSSIYEGNHNPGAFVDLYTLQGKDNTIIEDIYDSGGKTTKLSVKIFEEGGSTNYIMFENVDSVAWFHSEAFVNMPIGRKSMEAMHRFRFQVKQPQFEIVDGVRNGEASGYSGVSS